ncbi:hypothetical protein ACIPY5_19755 [Microbacterium sp. NPDC089698]|uniref:hypothetical protein n=1 Tax=Microbacterium sp. NPDC089698 TaxID=3364200 RepID=UPI0038007AD6
MTTHTQPAGATATRPCQAGVTTPAPWPLVTSDDYHRRRPGEPLGYVPEVGDRIRYALRHTRWCATAQHMVDGHDDLGEFDEPVIVVGIHENEHNTHYACKDSRGTYRGIDLDWWICEQVIEDGALW